jgi:hypothetical protein
MSIEWEKLWAVWVGWIVGSFLWYPIIGDLGGSLYDASVIGFFLGAVWLYQRLAPRSSRPTIEG